MVVYKDLNDFLAKHNGKEKNKDKITHTRIPTKKDQELPNELRVYAASYVIPPEKLEIFFSHYYEKVFVKNHMEYLTERQQDETGPLLVDFDFKYDPIVSTRHHSKGHLQDMVLLYLETLKEFFTFTEDVEIPVYVMEKPNVNQIVISDDNGKIDSAKSLTKDGIHLIIGIQMDHTMQQMLRTKVMDQLSEMWEDLPITNSWESVLDEGISTGKTNWQIYGSRKPHHQAYELTLYYVVTFDSNDGEFIVDERRVTEFDISKNIFHLSAQYPNHPKFEMNPDILQEYTKMSDSSGKPKSRHKTVSNAKLRLLYNNEDDDDDPNDSHVSISSIKNKDMLVRAMNKILSSLTTTEYDIKEIHQYTQILPLKYYEPGSHSLNTPVAFALKHTDNRLFLSWVMLRSNASDFDYDSIPELYSRWGKFNKNQSGITHRSIMYWAKQDAYDDYINVKKQTIDNYIEETISCPTDYDFAMVLYNMYKDQYVCASFASKPVWYNFVNHRWELDYSVSLRLCISREMHSIYQTKIDACTEDIRRANSNQEPERVEVLKKKSKYISDLQIRMKKTNDKNNIMKEAAEIFYDKYFIKNMDFNRQLLCFTNGVIDFNNKCFRDGYPQDYITKTTGIAYTPINEFDTIQSDFIPLIHQFMKQLFPSPELCKYMWDHLASCLIGTNLNQTFNIYRGNGSNGKSMMIDLMNHVLGEYAGTVPITLVTDKRPGVGGTSSEIIQLKGLRYAVMQEPSKDMRLNEGVMKELTGGDKIQARALYADAITFTAQFKLAVCTNSLFEINSNDDGTWRRIRICDFISKFVDVDKNEKNEFLKDKKLDQKLPLWAPVFASMLTDIAFINQGVVTDCDSVMESSNRYRQGQDHIAAFVTDTIAHTHNKEDKVSKKVLASQFKVWFQESQGMRKAPKGTELYEYMDLKFGAWRKEGWTGVKIIYPDEGDDFTEIANDNL